MKNVVELNNQKKKSIEAAKDFIKASNKSLSNSPPELFDIVKEFRKSRSEILQSIIIKIGCATTDTEIYSLCREFSKKMEKTRVDFVLNGAK